MKCLSLLFFVGVYLNSYSQELYLKEIETIKESIQKQLSGSTIKARLGADSNHYKIALLPIKNEDGLNTKLTQLIDKELSIDMTIGSEGKYTMLSRDNIENMSQGNIFPGASADKNDYAKLLGKNKKAQIMIMGTLFNIGDQYRLIFNILETSEGEEIGGVKGLITATPLLKDKDAYIYTKETDTGISGDGQGTNNIFLRTETKTKTTPVVPITGQTEKPKNMDPDCASKNIGNINVVNETNKTIEFQVRDDSNQGLGANILGTLTLGPKESNILPGITSGTFNYTVAIVIDAGSKQWNYRSGKVQVFSCKQQSITIK